MIKKERCYWFIHRCGYRRGCGVLEKLQCVYEGKCSFYETEEQFKTRQANFNERESKAFAKADIRGRLRSR